MSGVLASCGTVSTRPSGSLARRWKKEERKDLKKQPHGQSSREGKAVFFFYRRAKYYSVGSRHIDVEGCGGVVQLEETGKTFSAV